MRERRAKPGESYDRGADAYERGRPDWPEQVLDLLPIQRSATVLDLGAGTGKLTRVLARRYQRVYALEPLAAMRAHIPEGTPDAELLSGRAETIPLEPGTVEAVFVAQAFHWFANSASVAEIARVLRPAGILALLWQEPTPGSRSPLPQAYRRRFGELREEITRPTSDWRPVLLAGPFGALEESSVEHEQVSDRATVLDFAASQSWIACRNEVERKRVLTELGALLPEGEYRFPMRVHVFWTRRL